MNKVIEDFFTSNIRTDFTRLKTNNTVILVDGNIALYEIIAMNRDITPNDVVMFCNSIAEKVGIFNKYKQIEYNYETRDECEIRDDNDCYNNMDNTSYSNGNGNNKIISFDGVSPIQKIPQQAKRRKMKYNTFDDMSNAKAFELSNNWYIDMIEKTERALIDNGWYVISHSLPGEGEQKLVNYLRDIITPFSNDENYTEQERVNYIVWTKDWDVFVILLNLPFVAHIAIYQWMSLPQLPFLLSINMCILELEDRSISPLHFMASAILYGCDFFPGVGGNKLRKDLFENIITSDQFAFKYDEGISIDGDLLCNALRFDLDEQYDELFYSYQEMIITPNNTVNVMRPTSSSDSSGSDVLHESIQFMSYNNIRTLDIKHTDETCNGVCYLCSPKIMCNQKELQDSCYQYINMYIWTLNYFCGTLKMNYVNSSKNVYYSYIAPPVDVLCQWLKNYNVPSNSISIDIMSYENYYNTMREIMSLTFTDLLPCDRFPYSDKMLCKTFNTLSCIDTTK